MSRPSRTQRRSDSSRRAITGRHHRSRLLANLLNANRRLTIESLEQRMLLFGNPVINEVTPLPADGQSVFAAIDRLTVSVSEDLTATSANNIGHWSLLGAGPDHTLGTGDDVNHVLSLPNAYVSGTTVVLDIDSRVQPLQPGQYRFTATAGLVDLDAQPLDGDGNGIGGDEFVTTFTVSAGSGQSIESPSNDSLGVADPLDLVESPVGSGYTRGIGLGAIQVAGDIDYWTFDALAGDRVAISVDTPNSNMNPYLELRNSADGVLSSDDNSGPDNDAFISYYTVTSSGSFNARISSQSSTTGHYELRVDLVRGTHQLESDSQYANDSIAGADLLTFSQTGLGLVAGTVSGTIMAPEGANTDEDYYSLGILDPGDAVLLLTSTPALGTLAGRVRIVDSSGTAAADDDGDEGDGGFLGSITASDNYYAVVEANSGAGPRAQYLLDITIADLTAPRITSLTGLPDEGVTSSEVISSLSLTFSERMDPATVLAAGAFDLREDGPDGLFDTADDVTVDLVSQSSFSQFSTTVGFFLQSGPLGNGNYRFTVSDSVRDRAGNPINGNGTGSGPYVREFALDLPAEFVLEGPDNNVIGNATPFPLTEDPTSSGYFTAFGIGSQDPVLYQDYWSDPDYWSFQAQAGDVVRVAVDTPGSDLDPYFELRNASDGNIQSDNNGGPGNDSLTDGYSIPSDGTYYIRVGKYYYSTTVGTYQLRLDLARGINLESDVSYNNDSISSADPISFTTAGLTRTASVAGAVMSPEGSNSDEDLFNIGLQTAGNVVELSVDLPGSSSLDAQLRLVDASGVAVADADGDATDGHFLATLTQNDVYYAEVQANSGAGLFGTYVLNLTVTDAVPPTIRYVNRLPLALPGSDAYRDGVLANNPSVYLRLNETSGTVLADSSANAGGAHDGTLTGTPTYAQAGPFGISGDTALGIGGDANVSLADGDRVDDARAISFSFWMNVDSFANTWMPLINKGTTSSSQRSYALWLNSSGYLQFNTSDSSGLQAFNTSSGLIGRNSWNHIAGVVDRDTGRMKLWVNGVERIDSSIRTGDILQNGNPLLIGHTLESSSSYSRFAGKIDEFALWTEARTSQEILAPYFDSKWLGDPQTSEELFSTFSFNVNEQLIGRSVSYQGWDFDTFGGNTYVRLGSRTWADAEAWAVGEGAHLVTIDDQAEQDFVYSRFGDAVRWIGLSDAETEGTFVWADGTPFSYNHWASGYPITTTNVSYYDYVALNPNGFWYNNDYNLTAHEGIVEFVGDTDSDGDGMPDVIDWRPFDALNGMELRGAGVDGAFDTVDDVIYDPRASYDGNTTISVTINDGPLSAGEYRLTITDSVTDLVGNSLDGDRDGLSGGDFVQFFTIDPLPAGSVFEGSFNNNIGGATPLTLVQDTVENSALYTEMYGLGSQDPAPYGDYWNDPDYWSFEALAGDYVSISVSTPNSDVDPYIELRNSSDNNLVSDNDGGPGTDSLISGYQIPSDGTYYVRVGKYYYSTVTGRYEVRVQMSRGIVMETDAQYSNDSLGSADSISLSTNGVSRSGSIAGLIQAAEGSNHDEDLFNLGLQTAGNVVELDSPASWLQHT